MTGKRRVLGRGLSALIPAPEPVSATRGPEFFVCPIERIRPLKGQPRRFFDEERLAELVVSIKQQGLVQPLLVRPDADGLFTLIAGERRWRAAQRAGLHDVPVVVRQADDMVAFELALVENLQREDLNPIEEAEAFARLLGEHDYTQEQLAERIGKDRSTVANSLRLLRLPESVRRALIAGALTSGHARALLSLEPRGAEGEQGGAAAAERTRRYERLLREVVDKGLSVRQTEALVRRAVTEGGAVAPKGSAGAASAAVSPNARDLQERLARALGTRVTLHVAAGGRGRIELAYSSLDELERLIEVLLR